MNPYVLSPSFNKYQHFTNLISSFSFPFFLLEYFKANPRYYISYGFTHKYFGTLSLISRDLKKLQWHHHEPNKVKNLSCHWISSLCSYFTYCPQILCFIVLFKSISKQVLYIAFTVCLLSLINYNAFLFFMVFIYFRNQAGLTCPVEFFIVQIWQITSL